MAWESALDRLLLQQVHRASSGEARTEDVRSQLDDVLKLAPDRAESAFHRGYARVVLGLDLPEPRADQEQARRWYTLGRLRGHEHKGERNWVADLLSDPTAVLDLLREPRIAMQCLPLAMRTLFWSDNLSLAVKAIDYLSTCEQSEATKDLVDAALSDLLTRLQKRVDDPEKETTLSITRMCVELGCFEDLPDKVRAGYLHELGRRLRDVSEFEAAIEQFEMALGLAVRSQQDAIVLDAALATMRLHNVHELTPQAVRADRDEALAWLARVDDEHSNHPERWFVKGLLHYEVNDWEGAAAWLDTCTKRFRRVAKRDAHSLARTQFFLAAALLAGDDGDQASRALRLMETSLGQVTPDLESFYSVHENLKSRDRKLALRFLDAVDVGRGVSAEQLLFVALEYLGLGEAQPAIEAAERVLQVAVDLDQRVEAMRVLLTAHNMRGEREEARAFYDEIRELLCKRGRFADLEKLLLSEDFVGQALDHLDIKCELVALYEEMEDREVDKATLQSQIARSLKARKDEESLREAYAILQEVELAFPDLAKEELRSLNGLLELADSGPADLEGSAARVASIAQTVGHKPKVLVVGGNERQRRHHQRFEKLAKEWGFEPEWLEANYTSPQKLVATIGDRIQSGLDLLVLLHWNRHETTEPALELARKGSVMARTVHYAGFTSLQVALADLFEKHAAGAAAGAS